MISPPPPFINGNCYIWNKHINIFPFIFRFILVASILMVTYIFELQNEYFSLHIQVGSKIISGFSKVRIFMVRQNFHENPSDEGTFRGVKKLLSPNFIHR